MQNSYLAINASAGSGKTYRLVQRLLMIALRYPKNETSIRNILALTFTNKAANEMKERILSWLGKFVSEDFEKNKDLENIRLELQKEGIRVTLQDLHDRSKNLLDYILHHYSTLNIGTIDRFNARLVKSFSQELGLAKNFSLEIQPEPFLKEAVDQMLDQIGENDGISNSFMDFVNYGLDNDKRINLNETLYDSAKEFVKDIHYEHLKNNSDFDQNKYEAATKKLRSEIKILQQESEKIAQNSLKLIQEKGLENSDFYLGSNKTIQYFFDNFLKEGVPKLLESVEEEERKIESYRKGASKVGKPKEHLIFEILEILIENRLQIIQKYIQIQKKEKILSALLPLKVNKEIQDELAKIEEDNDLVLISKFNVLINENLKNEPSQFIYEKIGTQFHHYFFDEFQDTSALQWQNFVPLRDHSVSQDGTSFTLVGDPKQSIYRFRGGESQLMLNIIQNKENAPKSAEIHVLKENWRSAKNIVAFNNELYEFISKSLKEEHQDIFGRDAQQIAQSAIEGSVKINLIENGKKDEFYSDTSEKMRADIQECLNSGFKFSDIAILCRGNNDIFHYSQKLGALKVNNNNVETNIKTISESGLTLELSDTLNAVMNFLNWEANPKNKQFLSLMMYFLNQTGRIKMLDFTGEMQEILKYENRAEIINFIKEQYKLNLNYDDKPRLNLYNFVEYYLQEFSVPKHETDFLLNFLEMLYGFTQNSVATIKDFIKFWNDEARKQTIQASENVNAIQLMTIHKAKGLEFPIVLLPMENKHKDREFNDWLDTNEASGLRSVNIQQFNKNLETYDEHIKKFNDENIYKNFIDRLCIQYVATTRPVVQLMLYLQKPAKTNYLEIFSFVQEKNPQNLDEFYYYKSTKPIKKQLKDHKIAYKTESISSISKQGKSSSSSINIATPSKSYQNRNAKVRKGIFTHEILAKINSISDVEQVMEGYVIEGILTESERLEVQIYIKEIMTKYPDYFSENLKILNEQDIMISENGVSQTYRPDRIIETENGYIIIDFKTGEVMAKHQKQIDAYKTVLGKLGKKVLKAELIYL